MTIDTLTSHSPVYVPDGVVTAFPLTFEAFDAADVTVMLDGAQITVGFSFTGLPGSGTLAFAVAPVGSTLQALLTPSFLQEYEGPFTDPVIENALDRAALRTSWLYDGLARSIRVAQGDSLSALPGRTARAALTLSLVGFDSAGDLALYSNSTIPAGPTGATGPAGPQGTPGAGSLGFTPANKAGDTFTGAVVMSTTLGVTGAATLHATTVTTLHATGAVTLDSTLAVGGNATVTGTLGVTGALTGTTAHFTGAATLDSTLSVAGLVTLSAGALLTPAAAMAANEIGYMGLPQVTSAVDRTCVAADRGKEIYFTVTGKTATIPANASVAYPIGTILAISCGTAGSTTVAITSDTMIWVPTAAAGPRTVTYPGTLYAQKKTATVWWVRGDNVT